MRIGFNCRCLHAAYVTGVERYARNLLASLVEAAPDEEFVLLGCGDAAPLFAERTNVRRIGSCAWRSPAARHLWEQLVLPRLARSSRVDVLVNPINTAPVTLDRNIVVVHDLSFLEHPEWFGRGFRCLYNVVVPRAARRAAAVVTVSEFSKSRIVGLLGVGADKVHVAYPGADPVFLEVETSEAARVAWRYGLDRPYLLFVGSLAPRKNLAAAAAAFERARASFSPEHDLAVAGVSSYQFRKARIPQGLRLLGYVADDDLPGLYCAAKALVYPSLYEGFGLPPLEAMACGTPVIASNAASLPEAVGDAAVLVDPTDPDALAEAIRKVLTDGALAADLRERGLVRARSFSWDQAARRMLEVCCHVARSHRGNLAAER